MRTTSFRTLLLTVGVAVSLLLLGACGDNNNGAEPTVADSIPTSETGGEMTAKPTDTTGDESGPETDVAAFNALAGEWVGMWNNDTFGSSAPITLSITINDDGTASMTLGLSSTAEGSPFGLPAVEPSTLAGNIDGEILTVEASGHPVFGNITVSILASGAVEALATMDGVDGVAGLEVNGIFDQDGLDADYTITFPDGSEAVGTAHLDPL